MEWVGWTEKRILFFNKRTYLTMLLILKPCVGIIVSMLSFESFFNIVVFPALSSPRTRMRASSSERFNLRNKLSKPLKLKTNNANEKKKKNRERMTAWKSEQGQDILKKKSRVTLTGQCMDVGIIGGKQCCYMLMITMVSSEFDLIWGSRVEGQESGDRVVLRDRNPSTT